MKVAYNNCYGGFTLSKKASELLNKINGYKPEDDEYIEPEYGYVYHLDMHDNDHRRNKRSRRKPIWLLF